MAAWWRLFLGVNLPNVDVASFLAEGEPRLVLELPQQFLEFGLPFGGLGPEIIAALPLFCGRGLPSRSCTATEPSLWAREVGKSSGQQGCKASAEVAMTKRPASCAG